MKSQTSESVQSESKLNSDEAPSLLSLDCLEEACQKFMLEQVVHDTAHDINHIKRVVKNAKQIAVDEQADMLVVTAAAWLHDCVLPSPKIILIIKGLVALLQKRLVSFCRVLAFQKINWQGCFMQ